MITRAAELDAAGESLWRDLEASWGDQTKHDAFVRHCTSQGLLAAAVARYRRVLGAHPDDARARAMQERLVFLALQPLGAGPRLSRPTSPFYASPWFLAVMAVAAAIGAAVGIVYGGRS